MYTKLKNVRFMLYYFGVYAPVLLLILTFSPLTEAYSVKMFLIIIIVLLLISTIYSLVVVRGILEQLKREQHRSEN